MQPARIEDASTSLTPPEDWDEQRDGHCGGLPIRVETVRGISFMFSAWDVQPGEALTILAGGKVRLGVSGTRHPVVNLGVQPPPDQPHPVSTVRQMLDNQMIPCVEVETLWPPRAGSTTSHRARCQVKIGETGLAMAVGVAFQELGNMAKAQGWVD